MSYLQMALGQFLRFLVWWILQRTLKQGIQLPSSASKTFKIYSVQDTLFVWLGLMEILFILVDYVTLFKKRKKKKNIIVVNNDLSKKI